MAAPTRSATGDVQASFDASFDAGGTAVTNAFDAGTDQNRGLKVAVQWDGAAGHTLGDTAVTYNGVAMTPDGATVSNGQMRLRSYSLIAPATGSNTLSVDPSAGAGVEDAVISAWCYSGVDQTTMQENYNSANGSDASAPYTSDVTITSSATDRLVWVGHGARSTSIASGAATGFTERVDNVAGNIGSVGGEATGAASVVTSVAWTGPPASITWAAVGVSLTGIATAGPVIDDQPTAQTAVLNNDSRTSATFTCSALDDITDAAWDIETGVGTGVYTEIVDGGIYDVSFSTDPPITTLVVTPTDTTLSGRRVRARLTDAGGETTSDAVVLTVLTGPLLDPTSGTTNGSGVLTTDLTSDDPLTANGEVLLITATLDDVILRTTVRPATP